MITIRKSKNPASLAREWDLIAALRDKQIVSGKDHSANSVLAPAILENLKPVRTLIDIGCGTGWLTERASKYADRVVGVDPSTESIAIANAKHPGAAITYHAERIECFAKRRQTFDAAISNMSASSAPDLSAFFTSSRAVLKKHSSFIFTIPHPCFWPLYWGYASHPSFNYTKSCAVEGNFKIQKEVSNFLTTHFHHPLEQYLTTLAETSFQVEALHELIGRGFQLPRFMLIKSRAV